MKLVDAWGETHLEVETVPAPLPQHCQAGGPSAQSWPLQYYIARSDVVANVTAREVSVRSPDGSGVTVAAGVPVTALGDGTWLVSTGGLSFPLPVTEGDLGSDYSPSGRFSTPPSDGPVPWAVLAPGVVGRTAFGEVRWSGPGPLPLAGLSGVVHAIATVRVPCAEVRLPVDPKGLVRSGR